MTRRTFFLSGAAAATPPARAAAERPHLLFLMADQMRADCLGAAGHPVVKTPNLDRIAREGALFRHAYSSTPTCTPARAALLTGLSPWHHGMLGYGRVAASYEFEKPRALTDAGYFTCAIGKNHFTPQRNPHGYKQVLLDESGRSETVDFRSDYRSWFYSEAPVLNPDATGIGWNEYRAAPYVPPERLHPTRWMGDTAVRFLENYDRPEPFYLKVSFARPHSPYDPPERFWRMYADAAIPEAFVGQWAGRHRTRNSDAFDIWRGDLGRDLVRRARQGYYGSISFIDEQVGRILEALEKRRMIDRTLIVFTADHGDMTGDHNLWRKSYSYESSARIPMLLRWPGGLASGERGRTLDHPVELRDIFPTLLDAARARTSRPLDGASLVDAVRGRPWREFIDLEHDICYDPVNHWNALTDGRRKYIFHARDGEEQFFDLERDPRELHDIAGEPASATELGRWRERMAAHFAERGEPFLRAGKLGLRPASTLYSPLYPRSPK
jgi:arylsulfatase